MNKSWLIVLISIEISHRSLSVRLYVFVVRCVCCLTVRENPSSILDGHGQWLFFMARSNKHRVVDRDRSLNRPTYNK